MILYGLRNVSYIKFDSPLSAKISPYSKSKFVQMATNYTQEKLLELFDALAKTDKDLKTGKVSASNALILTIEAITS